MARALELARQAETGGEVPVGAVLVLGGSICGEGFNQPVRTSDPTAHAEIAALREASARLRNYRLTGTTLYVTLEPCLMCAGAILNARVQTLVFAARDLRFGAVRSKFRALDSDLMNHTVEVREGLLSVPAAELIREFFQHRR